MVKTTYQDFLTCGFVHLGVLVLASSIENSVGTAEVVDKRAKPARSRTPTVRLSMVRAR